VDLEDAAAESLANVKALGEHVEHAQQRLATVAEQVSAAAAAVEADWAALAERASAVQDALAQARAQAAGASQQAGQALRATDAAAGSAQSGGRAALREANEAVAALTTEVQGTEPLVAAMVHGFEAAGQALATEAAQVAEQVEHAVAAARQFLHDQVVPDLRDLQQQVHERAEALERELADFAEDLEHAYEHWAQGLSEVEHTVAEAFQRAGDHLHEMVGVALDTCAAAHQAELDGVAQEVVQAEAALHQVEAVVAHCHEQAAAAVSEAAGAMEGTHQGVLVVHAAVEQAKATLDHFTGQLRS